MNEYRKNQFRLAFKGSIELPVRDIRNGKVLIDSCATRNIKVGDITGIENKEYIIGGLDGCIIHTKKKDYLYLYPNGLYRQKESIQKFIDINTILNAYAIAKTSDEDFVIKL